MTEGKLTPVAWRNFEDSVRSYHGELVNKAELQRKFEAKLDDALANSDLIAIQDWGGMHLILTELIGAFANEPVDIPDD